MRICIWGNFNVGGLSGETQFLCQGLVINYYCVFFSFKLLLVLLAPSKCRDIDANVTGKKCTNVMGGRKAEARQKHSLPN